MKHVILIIISFLFICNSHAQNERAAAEAIQDLIGIFTPSERLETFSLVQEVKKKNNWNVTILTGTISSQYVFPNSKIKITSTTEPEPDYNVIIVISEKFQQESSDILISDNLKTPEIQEKIQKIKNEILIPLMQLGNPQEAVNAVLRAFVVALYEFVEDNTQIGGFDRNEFDFYGTLNRLNATIRVPWKSFHEPVPGTAPDVFSVKVTGTPTLPVSFQFDTNIFTGFTNINTISGQHSTLVNITTNSYINIMNNNNLPIARMSCRTYPEKKLQVVFFYVKPKIIYNIIPKLPELPYKYKYEGLSNADYDLLKKEVQKIYSAANVDVVIKPTIETLEIDYDSTKDGYFTIESYAHKLDGPILDNNTEDKMIRNYITSNKSIAKGTKIIVFIENLNALFVEDGHVQGKTKHWERLLGVSDLDNSDIAYIIIDNHKKEVSVPIFDFTKSPVKQSWKNEKPRIGCTVAHELGHLIGLKHPIEDFPRQYLVDGYDPENLMEGATNGFKFRKYQWDQMNNISW